MDNPEEAEAVSPPDLFKKLGLFETEIIRLFMKIGGEGADQA